MRTQKDIFKREVSGDLDYQDESPNIKRVYGKIYNNDIKYIGNGESIILDDGLDIKELVKVSGDLYEKTTTDTGQVLLTKYQGVE